MWRRGVFIEIITSRILIRTANGFTHWMYQEFWSERQIFPSNLCTYLNTYIEFCWFSPNFSGYFTCTEGYCVEIYDLKCERRCDSKEFDMRGKNSVIFSGEKIIIADCSAQSTATDSRLNSVHFCYNYLTLWWVVRH